LTASAVAMKFSTRMNVIVPRRLVAPDEQENTIGAVTGDGKLYLNQVVIEALNISQEYLHREKGLQLEEIGLIEF
jgi:predicted phosphoribosyltransferase